MPGTDHSEPDLNSSNSGKISTIDLNQEKRASIDKPPPYDNSNPNFDRFQNTLNDGNTPFWSKSMQEKAETINVLAHTMIKNTTVEPYLFLFLLSFGMAGVVSQNLTLTKYCLNYFHYPEDVCNTLRSNETLQAQVQVKATDFQMYKSAIETVPTVILAVFLGSWSDKNGRKFVMLMPCVGSFLSMIVHIVNVYFMYELEPSYLLIGDVFVGLSGGKATLTLGAFSYLIDTTTVESRTIRVALLQAAMITGAPIGLILGGVIYSQLGYIPVFIASAVMSVLCFIYVAVAIKETIIPESKTFLDKFCSFFDLTNIRDGFRTCFKKREMNRRVHVNFLIIAMVVNVIPMLAEISVGYYYGSYKFGWTVDTFSYYTTTTLFCNAIGLIFFLPLFIKLNIPDVIIGILGACCKVCSELIIALAPRKMGWVAFSAAPVVIFSGLNAPIVRSMLSKCVTVDEQGKVLSVVAALEAGMPLIGSVVYTQVYNATRTTFPGTFYVISAGLCLIPVTLFIWIRIDLKKQNKKASTVEMQNTDGKLNEETFDVHL